MRWLFLLALLLPAACNFPGKDDLRSQLSGDWIILYPEHKLDNDWQRIAYSRMQDSIVSLLGLKLLVLSENGGFRQLDSMGMNGKWGITTDKKLFIQKGGRGFEAFSASIAHFEKNKLLLTESVDAGDEKIRLTWHLKKLTKAESRLMSEERNAWRVRPSGPESEKEIRTRLSQMLLFYADYYELVTAEASFFIPSRVVLPFKFYQHAMGVTPFNQTSFFAGLFYDDGQAAQAHRLLSTTLENLSGEFPKKDDYVKEYAAFMRMMGERLSD